ncbi:MAG: keratin associated protein [Myxococcaceae bacterium]|nr:keratin associated protein [Myxococcaceae bacterium]
MNRTNAVLSSILLSCLGLGLGASSARAELTECGGIFLQDNAKCEYRKDEQCMTECMPQAVQTSCVAKVFKGCETTCTSMASTSCETSCGSGCTTDCMAQAATPAPKNCMGLCVSNCQGSCTQDGTHKSCCGHNCEARCEDECKNAPAPVAQPAECQTTCTSACSGSCTAQANTECQISCQDVVYTQCETELVDVCMTTCEQKGGAIFCDGQFINATNADSCSAELKLKLKIDVAVDAVKNTAGNVADATKGTASCASKKAGCSLSAVGDGTESMWSGLGMLSGAVGLLAMGRLRRKPRA